MTANRRVISLTLVVAILGVLGYFVATMDTRGDPVLAGKTLANMTDEERAIIVKGPVTLADYEQVTATTIACLRKSGFEVRVSKAEDGRSLVSTLTYGSSGPGDAVADGCRQLSEAVSAVWYVDHTSRDGSVPYPHLREMVEALRNDEARKRS